MEQQNTQNLPKNSIERIKCLLEKIDNLDLYFPAIHKEVSSNQTTNSINSNNQTSAMPRSHSGV